MGDEERGPYSTAAVALCGRCDQDMRTADGCSPDRLVYYATGEPLPALPWPLVGRGQRCPDCNALPGHLHHRWCDQERCPRCQGQLLSCYCPRAERIRGG